MAWLLTILSPRVQVIATAKAACIHSTIVQRFSEAVLTQPSCPPPSPTQVIEAAKAACIHDTIVQRFPKQYETVVGERGLRLR